MNDHRSTSDPSDTMNARAGEVGRDLDALRSVTTRELPGLDQTLGAARRRAARERGEGVQMAWNAMKGRPALAAALATLVVVVGLSAVPVSYQRTVGYDVALTVDGAIVDAARLADLAKGFRETLGAPGASVEGRIAGGKPAYVLRASADRAARAAAGAFVKQLNALGIAATVETTPRKETVSGNVYAYAMGRVIEIRTDGKSAAQLEAEIRDRLAAAGMTNAKVSVSGDGDDRREVRITASHEVAPGGAPPAEMPELVLTKDGTPLAGGIGLKVVRKMDQAGAVSMTVHVTHAGRSFDIDIPNAAALGDAGVASTIQSRLAAEGIDARVSVRGGELRIEQR